jgi:uncharacterized short protein YbdD (DUF466 family)
MSGSVREALRGLRRCIREATGEAKWDDYVSDCQAAGSEPMTRREFERRRWEQKECSSHMRCC